MTPPRSQLVAITVCFSACTGFIGGSTPSTPGENGGPKVDNPIDGPDAAPRRFSCDDASRRGTTRAGVRRLSNLELRNTLEAVLGADVYADPKIQGPVDGLPSDVVRTSFADFTPTHPGDYAAALLTAAERVIELSQAKPAREKLFGACGVATTITDACAAGFVDRFGALVYRRPLTTAERTFYVETFAAAGKGSQGLDALVFVLLQAPPLAFHVEYGDDTVDGARTRLSDFEIASRIAYLITAAPPDAELRAAAAAAGTLQNLDAVKAQVERLLAADSLLAHSRTASLFNYYADLNAVKDPHAEVGKLSNVDTLGLGGEMRDEAFDYFDHLFWSKNAGFAELMQSRDAFPKSAALQKVFGTDTLATGTSPVLAPAERVGFLHRPAVLASTGTRTAPILRGAHVRVKYLCDPTPPPPNELVDQVLREAGDIENQPNRSKVTQLTSQGACVGCHSRINPLGFAFEHFDSLGKWREQEILPGPNAHGPFAIDATVKEPRIDDGEAAGLQVDGSAALANQIATSVRGRACFVQKAFEFTYARALTDDDACALSDAETAAATGSLRDAVVALVANDDLFWKANR